MSYCKIFSRLFRSIVMLQEFRNVMRTTLFFLLIISASLARGQACLREVSKMYSEMDTCAFLAAAKGLPDSCQVKWYYYVMAEANFFCDRIEKTDSNTRFFMREFELDSRTGSADVRSKALLLISLLLEEYRRVKNEKRFGFWLSHYTRINSQPKCTTDHSARIYLVYHYEILRFQRSNKLEEQMFYNKKLKQARSISRREFRRFYHY